tara:strand:+ start:758 stop:1561 length:804 start_codon:yes stop_codon:yes gene_type:complete
VSLRLSRVSYVHPNGQRALHDIDLQLEAGEQVAIIGPSGAGKTTLLRLLATSLQPTSGSLTLLEQQPVKLHGRTLRQLRSRIGLIHQSPPLPPRQRVVTAVLAGRLGQWSLARALLSLCYPLDATGAERELARLDLADKLFQRCDQLSGGQQQRVGIARTLYQQPDLLLADEPVSAMDPVLADHTLALLGEVARERGVPLIASLHAVELALRHFPRVLGLRDGRVLFDKASTQVSQQDLSALYANASLSTATPSPDSPVATVRPGRC